MLTQGKISENTRKEEHKNEVMKISIPESNGSFVVDIIETTKVPDPTFRPQDYALTNNDDFLGYRLEDDEYFLF